MLVDGLEILENNNLDIIERDNVIGVKKDTPIDLNLIQSAIFNRNKNATKVKEIKLDNLDILIRAVKGHTIPNAFDEDIFFAILHLFVRFKDMWKLDYIPKTIYLTYSDLCTVLDLGTSYIDRIRVSLDKLASTSYKFTDTFLYRDVNASILYAKDLSPQLQKQLKLDSTVIIFGDKVYNNVDLESLKIKTFIIVDDKEQLIKLLKNINIQEDSCNKELSSILKANPITKAHNTNDKKLEHLMKIFGDRVIKGMQMLLDEEEFLASIRNEFNGTKISNYAIKKMSATSTFNLINFTEYKVEENNVQDMLRGAKLNKDSITSVQAFLENKVTSKSKYLLRIDINNYMYENLINKVYLKHSLNYLLEFTDKTARALYLFIESNKGLVKKKSKNIVRLNNPNMVLIDVELLAAYVSLSLSTKSISSTMNSLMRAMEYLRSNGYIKNYVAHRERPLKFSYFKVEFFPEQSRDHPEFKPYSIKVLPKLDNKENIDININTPNLFSGIPDKIKTSILDIPGITEENIDALITIYMDNIDKSIMFKDKLLNSSLGEFIIYAITAKIKNTIGIRSVSAYLYKMISTPKYYASELESVKLKEYNELYSRKALGNIEQAEEKAKKIQADKEHKEKLKILQRKIDGEWDLLSDEEKAKYIKLADNIIKTKKMPSAFHGIVPKGIFAKEILGQVYEPVLRFYIE